MNSHQSALNFVTEFTKLEKESNTTRHFLWGYVHELLSISRDTRHEIISDLPKTFAESTFEEKLVHPDLLNAPLKSQVILQAVFFTTITSFSASLSKRVEAVPSY